MALKIPLNARYDRKMKRKSTRYIFALYFFYCRLYYITTYINVSDGRTWLEKEQEKQNTRPSVRCSKSFKIYVEHARHSEATQRKEYSRRRTLSQKADRTLERKSFQLKFLGQIFKSGCIEVKTKLGEIKNYQSSPVQLKFCKIRHILGFLVNFAKSPRKM